jgi:hypothetical protein
MLLLETPEADLLEDTELFPALIEPLEILPELLIEVFPEGKALSTRRIFDLSIALTTAELFKLDFLAAALIWGWRDESDTLPMRLTWSLLKATFDIWRACS